MRQLSMEKQLELLKTVPTVPPKDLLNIEDAYFPMYKMMREEVYNNIDTKRNYLLAEDAVVEKYLPYIEKGQKGDIKTTNIVFFVAHYAIVKMDSAIKWAPAPQKKVIQSFFLDIDWYANWVAQEINRQKGPFALAHTAMVDQIFFIVYCILAMDNVVPENRSFYDQLLAKIRDYYFRYNDGQQIVIQLLQCIHKLQEYNFCGEEVEIDEDGNIINYDSQKYCTYIVPNALKSRDEIEADTVRASKGSAQKFTHFLLAYEKNGYYDFRGEEPGDIFEYLNERYKLNYTRDNFVRYFKRE